MINYIIIGIFIGLNLIFYIIFTIILDFITYKKTDNTKIQEGTNPEIKMNHVMIITFLSSLYLWILFIIVPIDSFLGLKIFYNPLNYIGDFLVLLGCLIILCGTMVAFWGRISRGKLAFSWGIPMKLIKQGMYKYIRHPLYTSYILYFIGFILVLQSIIVIPLLTGIYGYYSISKYEENILIDYFGQEYKDYKIKTGRFFPRILKRRKSKI